MLHQLLRSQMPYDDEEEDADGMRLRLWTAATNRPIVNLAGDIWAWRNMVEWYRQEKTPDSLTRAL
jgi:hypothetical protein